MHGLQSSSFMPVANNVILLNKPYLVLSQFTDKEGRPTLADHVSEPGYYPAGRLDYDSEGLMLLTNDGQVQHHVASPRFKMPKTYWVQVEGCPNNEQLKALRKGVLLKDGMTKPAKINQLDEHQVDATLWPRTPPIRERKNKPTSWLAITITEGRNRQVRRMTAAVNLPTLRLVRVAIGHWQLDGMQPGEWRKDQLHLPEQKPGPSTTKRYRPRHSKTGAQTRRSKR